MAMVVHAQAAMVKLDAMSATFNGVALEEKAPTGAGDERFEYVSGNEFDDTDTVTSQSDNYEVFEGDDGSGSSYYSSDYDEL
ncbi:hypothetical protein F441_20257 [Phytophthora nicotianae CJ01A1]|uniref:Uncharacterized protein n=4 Tax=Phytophthora nicotianae TaxID=4792 RepID=W2QTW0_PHYN3|nr:hypothetical protein PPTG_05720 [Phytophthora nicotianae INRA-310]ETL79884.1 hypothetical protein L917_19564 [Phytophthora nicotianae]ETN16533.1 hypothetical protein PPTG_05720 [Phytophthora nicotianae INRA-310]ETO58727.1 hypothetical protein F444_22893 [Phytophthora nicotianae P1976]ETP02710.1 hypothetical protein F441_20257 [Phytophthora nicotianae CJ01A1]